MGMSIDQAPNIDLAAIIDGGDEFMKRMTDFKAAKAAADESRANLGLAGNVVALRDEAVRLVSQAKDEAAQTRAAAFEEATKTRDSIAEWTVQTKAATAADREAAAALKAEAEKMHVDARQTLAEANRKHAEGEDRLAKATAAHEVVKLAQDAISKAVA
jgi:hypothetical protein